MPSAQYVLLEEDSSRLPAFFDRYFPGVTSLIPPAELISSFDRNPHLPLISIKCKPHSFSGSVVILGDAAHAMVPFYGQGMNAGLEDVRTLFSILDKYADRPSNAVSSDGNDDAVSAAQQRALALAEYTALRVPDAHAINDLALQNYTEMRASVLSPTYRLRKFLEESLSKYLPGLGWQTKYSRVSFGNERYSDVIRKSDRQGEVLMRGFVGAVGLPLLAGGMLVWFRYRRELQAGVRAFFGCMCRLMHAR